MRTVTPAELAQHASKNDCWVALHGKVFNVTTWLNDHPGGEIVVLDVAGRDGTHEFDEVGHSQYAIDLREKYLIGKLEGAVVTSGKGKTWTEEDATPPSANKKAGNGGVDDSGAYLFAIGAATASLALAMYLIRS